MTAAEIFGCFECGGKGKHFRGCSHDPSQPRPKPPDPPRTKGPSREKMKGHPCGSCGRLVGAPGLRHKESCPEFMKVGKDKMTVDPGSISEQKTEVVIPDSWMLRTEVDDVPPAAEPATEQSRQDPVVNGAVLVGDPPLGELLRRIRESHPKLVTPSAAALKVLRGPIAANAIVSQLADLTEPDLNWVLVALRRLARERRERLA